MTPEQIVQLEQDTALAVQINREGSWEKAQREAQAATIARNVRRWHLEKEKRERKARMKSLQLERYRLRNCRASLAEIVAAHLPKAKG